MNPPRSPSKKSKKTPSPPSHEESAPEESAPEESVPEESAHEPPPPLEPPIPEESAPEESAPKKTPSPVGFFLLLPTLFIFATLAGFLFSPQWVPPLRHFLGIPLPSFQEQTPTPNTTLDTTLDTTLAPVIKSQKNLENRLDTLSTQWGAFQNQWKEQLQNDRSFENQTLSTLENTHRDFEKQNTQWRREYFTSHLRFLSLSLRVGGADAALLRTLRLFDDTALLNTDILQTYQTQEFPSSLALASLWHTQNLCTSLPQDTTPSSATPPSTTPSSATPSSATPSSATPTEDFFLGKIFKYLFQNLVRVTPISPSSSSSPPPQSPCLLWHAQITTSLQNHDLQNTIHHFQNPPHPSFHNHPLLEKIKTLHTLAHHTHTLLHNLSSPNLPPS